MKTFNLYSYTVAKEILRTKNQVDKYGNPLWTESNLSWSIEVVTWFASLYNKAKQMVGCWCLRIKLAWSELTETVKEIAIKTVESANIIIRKPHRFTLNWVENFGITANYRASRVTKNSYKLRKQRCDNVHSNRMQRALN